SDPLWRAYIFTYHAGYDLLGAWIEAAGAASRRDRFRTLLTEPVTPSWAAGRVGQPGGREVDGAWRQGGSGRVDDCGRSAACRA
ncbi:MAG TPA: hypothetical protein VFU81_06170, partial [Thermomicrobiales bacterium]|nr:hypothetical protein [Thermomicrobiales bacterium]